MGEEGLVNEAVRVLASLLIFGAGTVALGLLVKSMLDAVASIFSWAAKPPEKPEKVFRASLTTKCQLTDYFAEAVGVPRSMINVQEGNNFIVVVRFQRRLSRSQLLLAREARDVSNRFCPAHVRIEVELPGDTLCKRSSQPD